MSELQAACFGREEWPTVSVVMPIRNEALHLEAAVTSILSQHYPLPFDVCLAIGPSDDDTEAVANTIAEREQRVSVVANPAGITPAALNAAISATSGEVVVRVDGHSKLSDGYIRRAVETMRRTGAVNVGGIQEAIGETPFEEAVAAAMSSWFGTGGSRFHVGGVEGTVDTVYLGVFDRRAGIAVGWFDDSLIRNQDYELNIRLRAAGGMVWFDPELRVTYRPRSSLQALAKQYYEYGYWKAEVLKRHPESLKLRQAVPPVVMGTVAVGLVSSLRWRRGVVAPVVYLALAISAMRRSSSPWRGVTAVTTMHASWSLGMARRFWADPSRTVACGRPPAASLRSPNSDHPIEE